jgi:predicted glutamine amidotransferase
MCGVLGFTAKRGALDNKSARKIIRRLFRYSESRGKEASGIAVFNTGNVYVLKAPYPASLLIQSDKYKKIEKNITTHENVAVIAHARLVTNGLMEENKNNQPVVKDTSVIVHNGIVVNDSKIWIDHKELKKNTDVDTEIIPALIDYYCIQGRGIIPAIRKTFNEIEGTASIAMLRADLNFLLLASNNGSLYVARSRKDDFLVYASEFNILKRSIGGSIDERAVIFQLNPERALLIDIKTFKIFNFSLNSGEIPEVNLSKNPCYIEDLSDKSPVKFNYPPSLVQMPAVVRTVPQVDISAIKKLRRCSRCILTETMPFIEFDSAGVCNYCKNYQPVQSLGEPALIQELSRIDSSGPFLFPLSGGRDSSFALHYLKNYFNLNIIAYSYDWGMLTDLGRRNQARMCGSLGVEHILVSADIKQKRENIRKNVLAWLKNPDLGTVPLFMAGDKHYFYYANQLQKDLNAKVVIYSENPFEKTDFKYGFAGIPPKFDIEHVYSLGLKNKILLASYYFKQYLRNPSLINSSIFDTILAYFYSYFISHQYLYFYKYKKWDENEIISTLVSKYGWELATDTKSTWRIGDGTAAFYNYIYYTVAGFTENDTFRSNQIREGVLSREEALKKVEEENRPRWESIKWYCDIIGIDFESTIDTINRIPKLYEK